MTTPCECPCSRSLNLVPSTLLLMTAQVGLVANLLWRSPAMRETIVTFTEAIRDCKCKRPMVISSTHRGAPHSLRRCGKVFSDIPLLQLSGVIDFVGVLIFYHHLNNRKYNPLSDFDEGLLEVILLRCRGSSAFPGSLRKPHCCHSRVVMHIYICPMAIDSF